MNTIPFRVASYNSLGLSLDSFTIGKMNCWLLLSLLDWFVYCPIETMQEGVRAQAIPVCKAIHTVGNSGGSGIFIPRMLFLAFYFDFLKWKSRPTGHRCSGGVALCSNDVYFINVMCHVQQMTFSHEWVRTVHLGRSRRHHHLFFDFWMCDNHFWITPNFAIHCRTTVILFIANYPRYGDRSRADLQSP
jgi:hypothetical protein